MNTGFESKTDFRRLVFGVLLTVIFIAGAFAQSVPGFGELRPDGQYGHYDARKDQSKLPIVLGAHVTPEVEALIRGRSSTIGGDIDYTLRAIPNYHRILLVMVNLGERVQSDRPAGSRFTVDCWFLRAVAFAPDDAIVRMIYSTYLNSHQRVPDANTQLEIATSHAKDNPFTHYNIELHYFDLKNYDNTLIQAHKALELGFPKMELKEQLKGVGKWRDPVDAAPTAASAPPEASK